MPSGNPNMTGYAGSSNSKSSGTTSSGAKAGSTGNMGSGGKSAGAAAAAAAGKAADAAHAAATAAQAAHDAANAANKTAMGQRGLLGNDAANARAITSPDTKSAMGQRGLLGGTILSNPSRAAESIGGLLGGFNKLGAQYGPGTFSPGYSGPKGVLGLNDAAMRAAANRAGFNAPQVNASNRELDLATRIALAESSAIKNQYGLPSTPALQAVADVMRNRVLSNRFPDTLGGVIKQPGQFSALQENLGSYGPRNPNYAATRSVIDSVMKGITPSVVGNSLNYGNLNAINNPQSIANPAQRASTASQRAFNGMPVEASFVSADDPTMQHSFGTIGPPSDVNLGRSFDSSPGLAGAVRIASAAPGLGRAEKIAASIADKAPPSMIAARTMDQAPSGFPAAPVTGNFPGRYGETPGAFPAAPPSVMAAREGQFAGNPSGFPAAPVTGNFPGRPKEMAGAFPAAPASLMAAREGEFAGTPSGFPQEDRLPSTFPGRGWETAGAFPAAPTTGNFPGRAFEKAGAFPAAPQSQIASRAGPFAGMPSGFPSAPPQVAQEDFANSALAQALGQIGKSVGTGFTGLAKGMKMYDDNKGKLRFANAIGINPIGDAVKGYASDAIRGMQTALSPKQPNQIQVAQNSPAPSSPPVSAPQAAPQQSYGQPGMYNDGSNNNGQVPLPTQWTGREPESQVADMQNQVEQVLRGYFVQIAGQQYPQYTTGPA